MTALTERARRLALYVLCSGMLMIVLDVSIVNVALPSIQDEVGFSPAGLAWVVNSYLISFGGLLLLAGRVGDMAGRKRVFLVGLAIFTVASALCGLAQSPWQLVAARFLQGAGGALTSAVILGMIVTMFTEPREQAQAIGIYAFVASAGGAIGGLAGGLLTQWVSWHWIFFVNLPIGAVGLVIAARVLPDDEKATSRTSSDVLGAALITAALMLGVYTIVVPAAEHGWSSSRTVMCGIGAVVLLAAFVLREARATNPLMPLRILRSRSVAGANIMQALGAAGMFGSFFIGALYFQHVLHYEPIGIGLAFLPVAVLMGGLSVGFSEKLVTRFGMRPVILAGLVLILVSLGLFAVVPVHANYALNVLPVVVLLGIGAGLCFPPLMGLAMTGVAPQDAGVASGLVNTTGQVGGAIGLAVLATVASGRTGALVASGTAATPALAGGYHAAFWVAAALVAAALLTAVLVLRSSDGRQQLGQPGDDRLGDVGELADLLGR